MGLFVGLFGFCFGGKREGRLCGRGLGPKEPHGSAPDAHTSYLSANVASLPRTHSLKAQSQLLAAFGANPLAHLGASSEIVARARGTEDRAARGQSVIRSF